MDKLKQPQRVVAIIEHAEYKKLRKVAYLSGETMSSVIREAIVARLEKPQKETTNG